MTGAHMLTLIIRYLLTVLVLSAGLVLIGTRLPFKYRGPVTNYGAFLFLCSGFGLLMLAAAYIGVNR